MQEEVDEKTLALIISGGKITVNIFREAVTKLLQKMEEQNRIITTELREDVKVKKKEKKQARQMRPGKRSLRSMMREGSQLSNIEITDNNIRSFEKVARKYGITYSLKKDRSVDPPNYLVFFRAKDVDVMTAAFKEYTGVTLPRSRKASIRKRLEVAIERSAKHRAREKVRAKDRQPQR